jgi:DNA damage-inducible protein 1
VSEAETVQADRGTGKDDVGDSFVPLQVLCEVNGFLVPAIIDTGAQITVMSASCAKRCRISNKIDARFSGRAVGVGSSDIIGRIDGLEMRVGPVSFEGRVSVLRDARVDFLIGLDLLKRFNTEVNLKDHVLKLQVRERWYKVPLLNKNSDLEVPSASSSASSLPSGSFLDDADLSESDFSDEYMAPELTAASSVASQPLQQQQPQYSRQIPVSTRSKEPALSLEGV